MAKKNKFISDNFMDDFDNDKVTEKKKKQSEERKGTKEKERVGESDRAMGSEWRKRERPLQKSVHLDEDLNRKINLIREIDGIPADDIIYNAIKEWMDNHYEEKKKAYLEKLG